MFEIIVGTYPVLEQEYDRALRKVLQSGEDQLMSTRQFCKVALNLDVVRGLEIDADASMEELDKTIYGIFDKNEIVQTKLMKKRKDNMKSIGHRFVASKAEYLSYAFNKVDVTFLSYIFL